MVFQYQSYQAVMDCKRSLEGVRKVRDIRLWKICNLAAGGSAAVRFWCRSLFIEDVQAYDESEVMFYLS